jgi:tRNA A-37 threonylcarbamoyl transferase component Bud32
MAQNSETQLSPTATEDALEPPSRRLPPSSLLIGTTLNDRYRIESRIGSGGMATVYLAFDQTLERQVAVKILNREISRDPNALERFRRESRAVAQLSHRHIVMVIDAGEDEGHPYIVFEHIPGETLKERIRRVGRLPISEAVAYAIEIGRALEAAHEQRLVHRDVKPQNVLIDQEGGAKVTDFGIARSLEVDASQLTAAGRVVGTTDYISPEQALGHEVTGQSDVYSLGIVLYEMLTGEVPFRGESSVSVAMKHVKEGLPDVQKRRPEISSALAAVVERATAKESEKRYPTVSEMVSDLEEVLTYEAARAGEAEGEATAVLRQLSDKRAGRTPWRRRMLRMAAFALAVLAVAVGAGVAIDRLGDGKGGSPGGGDLSTIRLGERDGFDYDPAPGDGKENPTSVLLALDGDPKTSWQTERYDSPELGNLKDGVGLYLDAGRAVVAKSIRITTPKQGWNLELYASNSVPSSVADWTQVGSGTMDATRKTFALDTAGRRFRYFLVWVTGLVSDADGRYAASISELRLLG